MTFSWMAPLGARLASCAQASSPMKVFVFVLSMAMVGSGGGCGARSRATVASAQSRQEPAAVVTSNIVRGDYVGSQACNPCHSEVVAVWRRSPMHRMTRLPETTDVRAPFDGREFRFKGDAVRFDQIKGTRFMTLRAAVGGERVYRVTKVIGGRHREDFAGLEVASKDPQASVIGDAGAELIMPASYVFQTASFRLKGYSVMVGERPGLRAGGVWNQTCIFCHNTIPYFDDLWGALHGPGAPAYQGEVVDRVLPLAKRMRYAVTDATALLGAIDEERAVLAASVPSANATAAPATTTSTAAAVPAVGRGAASGQADPGAARAALRVAITEARARFGPQHFIEAGVGCEACHGGSREHVDDPHRHPTFEPRSPFLAVEAGAAMNAPISSAEWQNRACARCHQVLFSRYVRTWEGGDRRVPADAGGSHITSGEGRDFLLGGCARAMACSTCHDPHGEDRPEALARLATPAGNGVCTTCHQNLAGQAALKGHAHHEPTGAGASCVACHMPKKNMGLGYALTRYHRIGSPTDARRVENDRPIECALCHVDKTVATLLADINRLWGKRYDGNALERLYGPPNANVLVATIERGFAHEQAAAIGAAGEGRVTAAAPAIAREIVRNGYPLVRYFAAVALAAIEGKPVPADMHGIESQPGHPALEPGRTMPAPVPGRTQSGREGNGADDSVDD